MVACRGCFSKRIDNIENKIERLANIGKECYTVSTETIQLCRDTQYQHRAIINFTSKIQSTFEIGGSVSGIPSTSSSSRRTGNSSNYHNQSKDSLNIIKELTAENRVNDAMDIVTNLAFIAKKCVTKSNQLTGLIEKGIDELPRFVQRAINKREINADGNDKTIDPAELRRGMELDVQDIQKCIDAIDTMNLQTAYQVGLQAFIQLNNKASRCQFLFESVETFAKDVCIVTNAFRNTNDDNNSMKNITNTAKSMLRIVRSSAIMKLLSDGVAKLLNIMVHLLEVTAHKISRLWFALANAKDFMVTCFKPVQLAKVLCSQTKNTAYQLIETSQSVSHKLDAARQLDMMALLSLLKDGEIQNAIQLASRIDNEVIECTNQTVRMIDKVDVEFRNIPELLTNEYDLDQVVTRDYSNNNDPDIPDVEDDIAEFETTTRSLDKMDFTQASAKGVRGFYNVSLKTNKCYDMIATLEGFVTKCQSTIESFKNVRDLESVVTKIDDLYKIIKVGERMKKLANRIQRLVHAMMNYMTTTMNKFSTVLPDFSSIVLPSSAVSLLPSSNTVQQNKEQFYKTIVGPFQQSLTRCQGDDDDREQAPKNRDYTAIVESFQQSLLTRCEGDDDDDTEQKVPGNKVYKAVVGSIQQSLARCQDGDDDTEQVPENNHKVYKAVIGSVQQSLTRCQDGTEQYLRGGK